MERSSVTRIEPQRIVALDVLRGFDMFWIIGGKELVLAIAGAIATPVPAWLQEQLEHTKWEGFTAWDLIMPLFVFVVGAAMPFSFSRRLEQGKSLSSLYLNIIRRSLILFILGMAVQGRLLEFNLDKLHIFANTLQAIAVGYLIACVLLLNVGIIGQVLATVLLLVGYWLLLAFVPLPEHGVGVMKPHENVALVVDQYVLGRFIDGTDPPYTWVLSGMTFTATVLLGVFAGHVLRSRMLPLQKLLGLLVLGVICLAGGWAWAKWLGFPIIKHIWTSSMTLWAAGWSYLLLAGFYLLIDIVGLRRWAFPFVVIGMNAITIYVAYRFIPFRDISKGLVGGLGAAIGRNFPQFAAAGPVLVEFTTVLLAWLVLYHLYRHKIFVRI